MTTSAAPVIVVGYDGSTHAQRVLDVAIAHARDRPGASLHLVQVVDDVLMPSPTGPLSTEAERERLLAEAVASLEAAAARVRAALDAPVSTHTPMGTARETLLAEASTLGATLIVVGTHGRTGLAHLLLGSVAEQVVRHATCPVLVVPRNPERH